MTQQLILLGIFILFLLMVFVFKQPLYRSAIVIPVLLEITGILSFKEAWTGLSQTSVITAFTMMILAEGLNKTGIIAKVSTKVIKPGASDAAILATMAIPAVILMQISGGVTVVAIMYPIIVQICAAQKRPLSKFIFPFCIILAATASLIPIGSTAAAYLKHNAVIESVGGVGQYTYFTNTLVKLPFSIIHIIIAFTIGLKIAPDLGNIPQIGDAEESKGLIGRVPKQKLDDKKVKVAIVIFVLTIVCVVISAITKIGQVYYPACVGAILMVVCGIMNDREALNAGANPMLLTIIGILPLGTAITNTGANEVLCNLFNKATGGMSAFWVMMFMYFICAVCTQFMSNSAVSTIFSMLAAIIAVGNGWAATPLYLAAYQGCGNSYLLPTAVNTNSMMFQFGGYTVKDWMKQGWIYTVVDFFIFAIWVPYLFPLTAA